MVYLRVDQEEERLKLEISHENNTLLVKCIASEKHAVIYFYSIGTNADVTVCIHILLHSSV